MMKQAIKTEYFGATNTRGAKIIASSNYCRVTRAIDYSMTTEANSILAMQELADLHGWTGTYVPGVFKNCIYWVSI